MSTSSIEQTPDELIDAALANEPIDLPVDYRPLVDKRGKNEIVATRIAQNIGPLLGVPYPNGPFGEASWLRNISTLTLDEVSRGAPRPSAKEIKERTVSPASLNAKWEWVGDKIYGDTPNTIISAATNRFGPEAKMAVTLAGINRLLEPQTTAIHTAVQSSYFESLATAQKLRAFGNMLFGVYRPQPLLFETGIAARNIQVVSKPTILPMSPAIRGMRLARCEISDKPDDSRPVQPYNFNIIDTPAASLIRRLPRMRWPGDIISGMTRAFELGAGWQTWEYTGNPDIKQHTVRASGDPSAVSSAFIARVLPSTAWRRQIL